MTTTVSIKNNGPRNIRITGGTNLPAGGAILREGEEMLVPIYSLRGLSVSEVAEEQPTSWPPLEASVPGTASTDFAYKDIQGVSEVAAPAPAPDFSSGGGGDFGGGGASGSFDTGSTCDSSSF